MFFKIYIYVPAILSLYSRWIILKLMGRGHCKLLMGHIQLQHQRPVKRRLSQHLTHEVWYHFPILGNSQLKPTENPEITLFIHRLGILKSFLWVRASPDLGLAECSVSKGSVSYYQKKVVSKKKPQCSALPVNIWENTKKNTITMSGVMQLITSSMKINML